MTKKELVTRLVVINQAVNKLNDLGVQLTGYISFEKGLTGELN